MENKKNTPKTLRDIEEILYKQVELLAEKSKECELEDLRENTRTILSIYSELKII
ncbi:MULTISPECIES: hypothetical protein [unclassified Clostridium]|uniref:hypothetical protein n=1 Tax=unclassified Clostridium TaxID=2614128 RepID=UPI000297BD35|nr:MULTISPECIES: hypothetical protein [unclassified Clostridium]EKQ56328.1 MAG: hypothetical protein A370_02084 [Clostridium sp. Maddingley MBC34-26]